MNWTEVGGLFWEQDGVEYQRLVKLVPDGSLIVEVGCFRGRSMASISDLIKSKRLRSVCIDLWDTGRLDFPGHPHPEFFDGMLMDFKKVMNLFGLEPLLVCGTSPQVAPWLKEAPALVFIDANHAYEWALKDIDIWWPLLAPGGVLCGHDYWDSEPGVIKAVNERFGGQFHRAADCSIWNVVKPQEVGK